MIDERVTPSQAHHDIEEIAAVSHRIERNEEIERLRRYINQTEQYRTKLIEVGVCPDCLEIPEMDEEGPFSYCSCGCGEDYAQRPLQKIQLYQQERHHEIPTY